MSAIAIWLAGWAVAALAMAIVWLVQRRTGRADRVDLAWTLGTGLLAASFALASDGDATRRALIATLASLWSLRLAWHLASRLRRSPEDGRYLRLRIRHGDSADTWLFWFFQVQALLCAFFAAPALIAARNAGPVGWPEALGVLVWAVAVAGETVADRQLSRFRGARPDSASVCRVGLWKYSRHPNYFFEWLHWWSYVCVGWQAPHGWLTLAGPVAMLLLILKVTGIPPTEEQALARRGEAYRRYQREVSAFFPWKPQGGFPVTASVVSIALAAAERGALPDTAIRFGIRRLCAARLRQEARRMRPSRQTRELAQALVAPVPEAANRQHYEVPAGFFEKVLGPSLKYSCCYWERPGSTLAEAEIAALRTTCARAEIKDGQDVLELGCGWGSAALWIAERYPRCRVTAVSNSRSQHHFITVRAAQLGLDNLKVLTADMNEFGTGERFDRVISIEMFEHMRNHAELMRRIASWLKPGGRLFVHLFCHRRFAYEFETEGPANWMGRYFFTGGLMPSEDLLPSCQDHLALHRQWMWSGIHYRKTALAWLENLDRERTAVLDVFQDAYGDAGAELWLRRWRIFFLACAELWGYRRGSEWYVSHYLFGRPRTLKTKPTVRTAQAPEP